MAIGHEDDAAALLDAAEADTSVGQPRGVRAPDLLIVSWQGRDLRVRHDDPHLGTYTPRGIVTRSAIEPASHAAGQVRLNSQDTWPARAIAATSETPLDPTRP